MNHNPDPVDRALGALRSQTWTGGDGHSQLEEKLMNEFNHKRISSTGRARRVLAASLSIVLLGGVGFAAAGGVETVKRWFVTVKLVGADGVEFEGTLEPISDDGTTATMALDVGDGKHATVRIERLESDGADLGEIPDGAEVTMVMNVTKQLSLTLSSDSEGAIVAGGAGTALLQAMRKARQPQGLTEIPKAELSELYVDRDGIWQELHVVRVSDEQGDGYTVYTTFINQDGELRYREVGAMRSANLNGVVLDGITFNDNVLAEVAFAREDGGDPIFLQVDLSSTQQQRVKLLKTKARDRR